MAKSHNVANQATAVPSQGSAQAPAHRPTQPPVLAIVGRPNVGKSTLFNRLVGSRRAIVGDEPGITRDRLYGNTEWRGRAFRVVDTGGIIPEDKDLIPSEIYRQARVALDEAAAIVLVVDGRSEIAAPDLELARLLRKSGKPLFLAVNKVDTDKQIALAGEFHRLRVSEVFPLSAEHGRGIDELLDAFLKTLPAENENQFSTEDTESTEESKLEGLDSADGLIRVQPTPDDRPPATNS
jgi:GTP-binding protein